MISGVRTQTAPEPILRPGEVQELCDEIDIKETGMFDLTEGMKILRMKRNNEMVKMETLLKPLREDQDVVTAADFALVSLVFSVVLLCRWCS